MRNAEAGTRGSLDVRGHRLVWGARTYVMGIVNVTPDSFSGDGCVDAAGATSRGLEQLAGGADIVDVGAESTRPGHTPLEASVERDRLLPVVQALRAAAHDALLSIDTFKPDVLRAAVLAGGDILNSVWGLDDALAQAAVECGTPVVIMHNRPAADYRAGVVDEVVAFLTAAAQRAVRAGIPAERVLLDPGIGFGKTAAHNLTLLGSLQRIVAIGFPTLIGTSRKSTIGALTGRGVGDRTYGTAATVALAIAAGIDVVRVHDVAAMTGVVRVADAVVRGWRPAGWSDTQR